MNAIPTHQKGKTDLESSGDSVERREEGVFVPVLEVSDCGSTDPSFDRKVTLRKTPLFSQLLDIVAEFHDVSPDAKIPNSHCVPEHPKKQVILCAQAHYTGGDIGDTDASMKLEIDQVWLNVMRLRKKAGMSQQRLADLSGVPRDTIKDGETGKRKNPQMQTIEKLAAALKISRDDLIDEPKDLTIPFVGLVGAGAIVEPFDDMDLRGSDITVSAPPGWKGDGKLAVVKVVGDSMYPRYEEGEYLFFEPRTNVRESCLGKWCICRANVNGRPRVYVKKLKRGNKQGLFTLVSVNTPNDIVDVELEWASPVTYSHVE